MTDWIADDKRYLFQNYVRQPIVIERGQGTVVWDTEGKEYLDFVGGIAVTSLGHAPPAVVEAVTQQSKQLIHVSNLFHTKPMVELAKLLVERSCLDRVFFCNSGTEAVEAAIKLARRWGKDTRGGAYEIITAANSFHGRTLGALAATGNARYREPFEPMVPGFRQVPWNDIDAMKAATRDQTVAVLLEPIQGEGGVNMPAPGYLRAVREWCSERGLLFILDEIQTGIGRTGTLFAYEQEGVEPDIMCLAKGLAGGFPVGAVLARDEIALHIVPGDHGTTFGGNPVAMAAGIAVLRYIDENNLLAHVRAMADRLMGRLRSMEDRFQLVTEVRGRGLLLAIGLSAEVSAEIVHRCRQRGLLVNNVRADAVRFMPPLTVSAEEVDRAADILEGVLEELTRESSK